MANKQTTALFKKYTNLCEINREYPCLERSSSPLRHLSTSEPLKKPVEHNIEKIVNKMISQQPEKDLDIKNRSTDQEQTEIIELFHEAINPKLKRKPRSHLKNKIDNQCDNKNES